MYGRITLGRSTLTLCEPICDATLPFEATILFCDATRVLRFNAHSILSTVWGFKIIGRTYGKDNVVYQSPFFQLSPFPRSFGVECGECDDSQDRAQTDS